MFLVTDKAFEGDLCVKASCHVYILELSYKDHTLDHYTVSPGKVSYKWVWKNEWTSTCLMIAIVIV